MKTQILVTYAVAGEVGYRTELLSREDSITSLAAAYRVAERWAISRNGDAPSPRVSVYSVKFVSPAAEIPERIEGFPLEEVRRHLVNIQVEEPDLLRAGLDEFFGWFTHWNAIIDAVNAGRKHPRSYSNCPTELIAQMHNDLYDVGEAVKEMLALIPDRLPTGDKFIQAKTKVIKMLADAVGAE